jgi:hypothetical protein
MDKSTNEMRDLALDTDIQKIVKTQWVCIFCFLTNFNSIDSYYHHHHIQTLEVSSYLIMTLIITN